MLKGTGAPLACVLAIHCSLVVCYCMLASNFACPNALHPVLRSDRDLEIESRDGSGDTLGDMGRACMDLDSPRGNLASGWGVAVAVCY